MKTSSSKSKINLDTKKTFENMEILCFHITDRTARHGIWKHNSGKNNFDQTLRFLVTVMVMTRTMMVIQ